MDPADEIARRKFINCILGTIAYATHELPTGYLGVAQDDLALLCEAEAALKELPDEAERIQISAEIRKERKSIEDYIKMKSQRQ